MKLYSILKSEYGKPFAIKILWHTFYYKKWKRFLSKEYKTHSNRSSKSRRKLVMKTSGQSVRKRARTRRLLTERDGYKCRECGSDKKLTVDHIVPLKITGRDGDVLENKQFLCEKCHKNKTRIENKKLSTAKLKSMLTP